MRLPPSFAMRCRDDEFFDDKRARASLARKILLIYFQAISRPFQIIDGRCSAASKTLFHVFAAEATATEKSRVTAVATRTLAMLLQAYAHFIRRAPAQLHFAPSRDDDQVEMPRFQHDIFSTSRENNIARSDENSRHRRRCATAR